MRCRLELLPVWLLVQERRAAWALTCQSELQHSSSAGAAGCRAQAHLQLQCRAFVSTCQSRLQNQIKVKDRELDGARKEITMLKSTASSHERYGTMVAAPCIQLIV